MIKRSDIKVVKTSQTYYHELSKRQYVSNQKFEPLSIGR